MKFLCRILMHIKSQTNWIRRMRILMSFHDITYLLPGCKFLWIIVVRARFFRNIKLVKSVLRFLNYNSSNKGQTSNARLLKDQLCKMADNKQTNKSQINKEYILRNKLEFVYDSENMKDFSESYTKTNISFWYQFWNIGGASVFTKYVYDFDKKSSLS